MTRVQNQMPLTCLEPIHLMCHVLLTVSKMLLTQVTFHDKGCYFLFVQSYAHFNHFQSSVIAGAYEYHLRVYVYQARNLFALDKDSFSG